MPVISVIIPVRNEAENILAILQDIAQQKISEEEAFPTAGFEVFVVNDHSDDYTAQLVKEYQSNCSYQLHLLELRLPLNFAGSHKKMAIAQAVGKAKGDIIVTTDGDCRVGMYWLATLGRFFHKQQPALVSGPVVFHQEKNLFHRLQTIEFASLIGTGAASMHAHKPNMCNGANLAFTKEAFYRVGGYEGSMHVPSGDDEFLMQKIFQKYPRRVFFIKSQGAVVYTHAKMSLKEFYYQRRRWAGKWKLHKNKSITVLAVFIFFYHCSFLTVVVMAITDQYSWLILWIQLLPKIGLEFFFLRDILQFMKKRMFTLNFILLEFIYSAYVVFFGICANFGSYTWKNRQYK